MIKIENTESEMFESAYFIVRQNAQLPKKTRRDDMLREAARIVNEKMGKDITKRQTYRNRIWLERSALFASGASAALLTVILMHLF